MKEMHSPTLTYPANTPGIDASGTPLAGQYDVPRIVGVYEAYFRAQIEAGRVKLTEAPKQAKPHSSNRVDGLSLDVCQLVPEPNDIDMVLYELEELDEFGDEMFEVEFSDGHGTSEMLCWNCGGLGHTQRDKSKPAGQDWICPSPKKRRDPKAHIAALTKLATARGGGIRPRVKVARRPTGGQGPKNRFATRSGAKASEAELGDEDGADESHPVNELSSVESAPSKVTSANFPKVDTSNQPAISSLEVFDNLGDIDDDFKKAFGISLNLAEADVSDEVEENVTDVPIKTSYFLAMMATALCLLAKGAMLIVGNLAHGPGRAARLLGPGLLFALTIFALITACSGFPSALGDINISINMSSAARTTTLSRNGTHLQSTK